MLRQTILLLLAFISQFCHFQSFTTPLHTSLKMLCNFLGPFCALLVLTNLLNEEFLLHSLCNFLITLAYSSTLSPPSPSLSTLPPPALPRAMGGPSTILSLPPLTIPTANRRPCATGRHGSLTAIVGGHCHLPPNDRLPTLPGGAIGPERVV